MGTISNQSLTPGRRMSFTTHEPIIAKDRSVVNISCADHDQSFVSHEKMEASPLYATVFLYG